MKPSDRLRLYWLMRKEQEDEDYLAYDILTEQDLMSEQNYITDTEKDNFKS